MAVTYGDFVLEPNSANRRQTLSAAVMVGVMVVAGAAYGGGLPAALVAAALVVVGIALLYAHATRSRITVTSDEIIISGLIFRKRRSRARLASIVRATLIQPKGPQHENLFLLSSDGKVVLRIYTQYYATEDIDRLLEHLGVPWSGPDRVVTAKQLCETYPGLVRWHERRPFMFAFAVAGAFMLVIVIVATWIGMTHLGI